MECPKGDPFNINKNELPSCKLEGEDLSKYFYDPNGSDPTTASTVLGGGLEDLSATSGKYTTIEVENLKVRIDENGNIEFDFIPGDRIIEQPNKDYDLMWSVDEKGKVHYTPVDKNGDPIPLSNLSKRE